MSKTKIEWTTMSFKQSKENKKLMEINDYATPMMEKMKNLLSSKSKNVKNKNNQYEQN